MTPPQPPTADLPEIRRLFDHLLGPDRINALAPSPVNATYTAFVTVWLLVYQRLTGNGTLADAVAHLLATRAAADPAASVPSANTGAYNHARQRLSADLVEHLADRLFDALTTRPAGTRPIFALDGTTLRLAPTPALRRAFPPAANQHGASAWPILHVGVAHDLDTGLAVRPAFGPMYGPGAVSELDLVTRVLARLPAGATVLGDANFGVFGLAHAATRAGHPVLVRLTPVRFRAMARAAVPVRPGTWALTWRPTRADRRTHPGLPADAAVTGWIHACAVTTDPGGDPLTLYLFTTVPDWDGPAAAAVYKRRQQVETDLRSLKTGLKMAELTARTPDMVGKEVVVGVLALNLVHQVRRVVAAKAGVPARRVGFSSIWGMVRALLEVVGRGIGWDDLGRVFDRLVDAYGRARLPNRKGFRSYPREIIPRGRQYPWRKRVANR